MNNNNMKACQVLSTSLNAMQTLYLILIKAIYKNGVIILILQVIKLKVREINLPKVSKLVRDEERAM